MAFFMGNVMAPATDSVMGAVPEAKAGVGSAMNDVTRQVGGALGIAIIGLALNSMYSNQMADVVTGLPAEVAEAASDSVGGAIHVAAQLPGAAGEALTSAARLAFMDGIGIAVMVAALSAAIGAVVVHRYLPADHEPMDAEAPTAGEGDSVMEVA